MTTTIPTESAVLETLRQIVDPEIACNIVDLGLIYGVICGDGKVTVTMTLTTAGCPMHESLWRGVKVAILSLDGVAEAEVELVWDPPWHPSMMTDAGRAIIGISSY